MSSTLLGWIGAAAGAAMLVALPAGAHGDHAARPVPPPGTVKVTVPDIRLQDQDGRAVRVKSDVFGDRLVVINFVFTTCTTVCPVSSATMAQLQDKLGERVGKDVVLVSMSVDPARDTPARLKEYAAKHGARGGWTWLTGRKGDVDQVTKAFGAYTINVDDHPALVMVGDPRSQAWTRFFGFPGVDELNQRVEQLTAARAASAAAR
jgi:protein SCO1/2